MHVDADNKPHVFAGGRLSPEADAIARKLIDELQAIVVDATGERVFPIRYHGARKIDHVARLRAISDARSWRGHRGPHLTDRRPKGSK
jgi:hypothetical protein